MKLVIKQVHLSIMVYLLGIAHDAYRFHMDKPLFPF
jgi:hypothetical protein